MTPTGATSPVRGVDWPHLEEIVTQILAKKGGEWEKDPGVVCSRTLEEEEGADLDMDTSGRNRDKNPCSKTVPTGQG
ncbi:hypothetical protein Y1Q_0013006 [Alligator mississippiensis]|uniref:Uncharacterized protein n=1 Tax=Alligator mississippiensis TaxID=8496 RepID=A0A151MTG3_ALLMI|nr:hypothetical protein Y1Q_0013006 [Alligator mississippiensis]